MAFSADGKSIISATMTAPNIRIWETATGKLLREIDTAKIEMIYRMTISGNGQTIAVSGSAITEEDNARHYIQAVFDVRSGKELRRFDREPEDRDYYEALVLTPDGNTLFSRDKNGAIRAEDVATGKEKNLRKREMPCNLYPQLAISYDGSTLAFSSKDRMYVWKWQEEKQARELGSGGRATGSSTAFSTDGKRLIECDSQEIRVWNVAEGGVVHRLEVPHDQKCQPMFPWHVTFTPDGKTLIACCNDSVYLWDADSGKYRRQLDVKSTWLRGAMAVSPDSRIVAFSDNQSVRLFDLTDGKELAGNEDSPHSSATALVVSDRLAVTAGADGTAHIWDLSGGKHIHKLQHDSEVAAVALSPDDSMVATSSLDDSVCIWDVKSGKQIQKLRGHGNGRGGRSLRFTPDGKYLLSWGDDFYARKFEVATGKAVDEPCLVPKGVKLPDDPDITPNLGQIYTEYRNSLKGAFTPDCKFFVMNVGDAWHVFDLETAKDVRRYSNDGDHEGMPSLAVSPNGELLLASVIGKRIATRLPDGKVEHTLPKTHPTSVWDLSTGKLKMQLMLPDTGPVAFSSDSKRIAVVTSNPKRISWWDIDSSKELGCIKNLPTGVSSLAFTPDGKRLLAGLWDTTVLVWELAGK
jgi:WD40 repeat protein